jgi:hypothetical protein
MKPLRERVTYANAMSSLAVFVTLGFGTAYAADKIGSKDIAKNAVKSKHIKAGNVKKPDLAAGAVNTAKVADGSLLAADFAAGQLPQGPRGEQGPQGPAGPSGATSVTHRTGPLVTVSADKMAEVKATCLPRERATGGGHFLAYTSWGASVSDLHVADSLPNAQTPTAWTLFVTNIDGNNDNTGSISVRASVICAAP